MKFTKYQWVTAITVGGINVLTSTCVGLQSPFYPAEAERKGASATEYGFVFGVYELTSFIISVSVSKIVEKYDLRYLIIGGILVESVALIFFGLLDYIDNRVLFIVLSIILRIVEASGGTIAVLTGFSLVAMMFPGNFSTMFGITEIFFGSGFVIGPSIGGILYTIGGFPFPFIFVGIIGLIIGFSILMLFCGVNTDLLYQQEKYDVMPVLRVPALFFNLVCVLMIQLSGGFYSALLEPFLRQQFNSSAIQTSLLFVIYGISYVVSAPICGKWLDRSSLDPKIMVIAGCICVICSFIIVGPAPYLPYKATITSCTVALIVEGLGFAAIVVGGFTDVFRSAGNAGLQVNTIGMFALIGGIWSGAITLGNFLGPSIAGILYDLVGFQWATQFIVGCFVVLTIVAIIFTVVTRYASGKEKLIVMSDEEERAPLLTHQ